MYIGWSVHQWVQCTDEQCRCSNMICFINTIRYFEFYKMIHHKNHINKISLKNIRVIDLCRLLSIVDVINPVWHFSMLQSKPLLSSLAALVLIIHFFHSLPQSLLLTISAPQQEHRGVLLFYHHLTFLQNLLYHHQQFLTIWFSCKFFLQLM